MTPRFPRRRTALARKLVKSMVATVLVATTLFGATSAQAKLVITSALRSISAETSGSAPSSDSTAGTEDRFDQSVSSQVLLETGDGASAGASLPN